MLFLFYFNFICFTINPIRKKNTNDDTQSHSLVLLTHCVGTGTPYRPKYADNLVRVCIRNTVPYIQKTYGTVFRTRKRTRLSKNLDMCIIFEKALIQFYLNLKKKNMSFCVNLYRTIIIHKVPDKN